MKKVLVIYYSQTGQLFDILKQTVSKLEADEQVTVSYHQILPQKPFPFPWDGDSFYGAFPETFLQVPTPLENPKTKVLDLDYDLVILGYQPWYLSPSIPINSFLKSDLAKRVLKDKPVITVLGCRNMWYQAQEKVKILLLECKAQLVGNIVLVDRSQNHVSVITIAHWMFSGKKTRFLGFFPKPGVSEEDINNSSKYGEPISKALKANNYNNLQQELLSLGAVKFNPFLSLTDKRGNLLFSKWANLIAKKGEPGNPKRKKWLVMFKYYLLFAIWIIAPIVFIVFLLTYFPKLKQIRREKAYFSSVQTKVVS